MEPGELREVAGERGVTRRSTVLDTAHGVLRDAEPPRELSLPDARTLARSGEHVGAVTGNVARLGTAPLLGLSHEVDGLPAGRAGNLFGTIAL